jgi:PAS domain S-box-containing protein
VTHDPIALDLTDPAGVECAALDLLPSGIGIFDKDFNLVYANQCFGELRVLPERLCVPGTRLEDIVRHIAARGDYGAGEVDALVERRMAEIRTLDEPWEDEQDIEGRRRLAICHTPVPCRGLVITYADVTDWRATERKLRESEERYSLVTDAVAEGIYDWNVADNTLYVSERVMEILGLEGHLTSENWYAHVHPDDAEIYRYALRECFRGKTAKVACEYRIKARDGNYRWVEDHGLPIRDAAGRAIRLVGCVADITTKRQLSEELDHAKRQLEDAIESISEGFALFDPQDRIVMCNSHYRSWFTDVAHMVRPGNTFESFMRAAVERGMFPAAANNPEGFMAAVLTRRRNPSGPREQYLSSGISLQISDYKMRDGSHVSIYTDITEQKDRQAEIAKAKGDAESALEQLKAAQQQLIVQGKLASLGQLTAGIAHEIKNPLNFVNNFAALSAELVGEMNDMLAKATLDTTMRGELEELTQLLNSNLQKVVQHGKRADSIVKNMLQHSREGSGEHRPADINAIVDESLSLAYNGARAEKAGFSIALQRDFDPSVGMVDVYPQEITRVLLNVISNGFYAATKRKSEAGEGFEPMLAAATKSLGHKVEIRIRDNGTGIPEEVKEKIFNPFFTTKPSGEGTGLGLSMSHDVIVKQHGGSIDVETKPGFFTEFRIVLPRTRQR